MKLLLENWRRYLNEVTTGAIIDYLESAFEDTHVSGRAFTKEFDELNEEDVPSEAMEIINDITPEYIASVLDKYKSTSFKGSINMDEVADPKEIAIINSIMLFTSGNVASVRNPEKFKPEDAKELRGPKATGHKNKEIAAVPKYYRGKISGPDKEKLGGEMGKDEFDYHYPGQLQGSALAYILKPTKVMYTIARQVITQIANMKNPDGSTTIFRGLSLPPKVALSLKPGMEFNPGRLASWTTKREIAERFGSATSMMHPDEIDRIREEEPEQFKKLREAVNCTFVIKSSEIGASISDLSTYKGEYEFILGRKVKIIKVDLHELRGDVIGAEILCDEI